MIRKLVPQRTWSVEKRFTAVGSSGAPCSNAAMVLCSAPWYSNTRRISHPSHQPQVPEEQRHPEHALGQVQQDARADPVPDHAREERREDDEQADEEEEGQGHREGHLTRVSFSSSSAAWLAEIVRALTPIDNAWPRAMTPEPRPPQDPEALGDGVDLVALEMDVAVGPPHGHGPPGRGRASSLPRGRPGRRNSALGPSAHCKGAFAQTGRAPSRPGGLNSSFRAQSRRPEVHSSTSWAPSPTRRPKITVHRKRATATSAASRGSLEARSRLDQGPAAADGRAELTPGDGHAARGHLHELPGSAGLPRAVDEVVGCHRLGIETGSRSLDGAGDEPDESRNFPRGLKESARRAPPYGRYEEVRPYRRWNRSTRPPVSTNFCLPV